MTDELQERKQQELTYWFNHEETFSGTEVISMQLVEQAYQDMDLQMAKEVRDELTEAIERMENNDR